MFNASEILACEQAGIIPLVPKPLTSNSKAKERFDKRDFIYGPAVDAYQCPAGELAIHRFTTEENGLNTTPLLTKTLPKVRTEISLAVLAYNMKRMIKIVGMQGMLRAIAA